MKIKEGQSFRAIIPFGSPWIPYRIHIDHIIQSKRRNKRLIIYSVWGKHKQWWHEFMCSEDELKWYVERANLELAR